MYIMVDCADSVSNPIFRTFDEFPTRLHCWFHLKQNSKRTDELSKEELNKISEDLNILNLSN